MVSSLYKGWIVALEQERVHLEQLGIKLGSYNSEQMVFLDCEATEEQVGALQEFYGQYYWRFW